MELKERYKMLEKTDSFLQGSYELARDHKQQQSKEENKLLEI